MAETIKNRVADAGKTVANAGHAVAEAAAAAGRKVVQGAESAVDYVKHKTGLADPAEGADVGVAGITEHMKVVASCGKQVGVVDRVDGGTIKLAKNGSPDGQHHYIPTTWVDHVDSHVHLTKNSVETEAGWKSDASSC